MISTDEALIFNCGFARVAVLSLSAMKRGKSRSDISLQNRREEFQELFSGIRGFVKPDEFWEDRPMSVWNRGCDFILDCFGKRWHPKQSVRSDYVNMFSESNWNALPQSVKDKHTLSECNACANEYFELQMKFPGLPRFEPERIVTLNIPDPEVASDRSVTRRALSEINDGFCAKRKKPFLDLTMKHCPEANIVRKESKTEKKRRQRNDRKKTVACISDKLRATAADNLLRHNESFSKYQEKRLGQGFVRQDLSKPKRRKISDQVFDEFKEIVEKELSSWPENTPMNWSELGRRCNVPNTNKGQIVKEIAEELKLIDVDTENRNKRTPRSCKAKLPGGEISMPTLPTVTTVKDDICGMVASNKITLGEPCCPFTIHKVTVVNGEVVKTPFEVQGRKVPLVTLRQMLLKKQENFMHLKTDEEIEALPSEDVARHLQKCNICVGDNPHEQLKQLQRTRRLVLWHDHSNMLSRGYLLMAINALYDPIVYKSTEEYCSGSERTCERSVQELVEEPELYMISCSSSSLSDQLATIADRLDCLIELNEPVFSSDDHIPIHDRLQFFAGDHPAQSFERGSQVGGNYRCGSCGYKSTRGDDLAHIFSLKWRSLEDLQKLVISGTFGNRPGILKPFANLSTEQLVQELRARNVFDLTGNKPELTSRLQKVLCGTQRVPTILVKSPTQSLSEINLDGYTVLDCEPLHDLKGHLINLLPEISYIVTGESKIKIKELVQHLMLSKKQNGYSGSDMRICLIELDCLVQSLNVSEDVKLLLKTAVQICKILYSSDDKRSPRTVLQLYNCTWLHHELCKSLLACPRDITYEKLFGLYLHALVVHAPRQYEVVCLRSVNTENQERMFQQAKQIARHCTNRHPDNVIAEVLVRMQYKSNNGDLSGVYKSAETRVENVANKSTVFAGTRISNGFIEARSHSWQSHLKRISRFLLNEKVWWDSTDEGFVFFDGDDNMDFRPEGPVLYHFRSSSLDEIEKVSDESWKFVVDNCVKLPCVSVRIFDENGDLLSIQNMHTENAQSDHVGSDSPLDKTQCSTSNSTPYSKPSSNSPLISMVSDSPPLDRPSATSTPLPTSTMKSASSNMTTPTRNITKLISRNMSASNNVNVASYTSNDVAGCTSANIAGPDDNFEINFELPTCNTVSDCHKLESKTAILIADIIGFNPEIARFDKLHLKCKSLKSKSSKSKSSSIDQRIYTEILASLQTKVLEKKKSLLLDLKKYEKDLYTKSRQIPSSNDKEYHALRQKVKQATALLGVWSIKC